MSPVGADPLCMRIVLEWLGLIEPQRGRRHPVAVPSWAPKVAAAGLALILGAVGFAVSTAIRLLLT
jgi:hypothetical protein